MKKKRFLTLVLAATMLVSVLTSCGEGTTDDTQNPGGGEGGTGEQVTPQYVYVADYKTMSTEDININYINDAFWNDGKITLMASIVTGQRTVTYDDLSEYTYNITEDALLVMNEDGTDLHRLEGYVRPTLPEGTDGDYYLVSMREDKDGNLWEVLECYINMFEYPEDWDADSPYADEEKWDYYVGGEEQFLFRKLDQTGAEILRFDDSNLKGEEDRYFYVEDIMPDDSGNLYMTANGEVIAVSPDGTKLFTLEPVNDGSWISSLFRLPDGTVATYYYSYDAETEKNVCKFLPIDGEAKAWKEPLDAPDNAYNFYSGGGEYDLFYQYSDGFYGYKFDTDESTKIFSWIDVDVDSDYIQMVMSTDDGRILAFSRDYSQSSAVVELVTLSQVESSTVPEKTILTYGCLYLDYNIRKQILNFNRTNDRYRIQVLDYSEFATDGDSGLTKLTVEMTAGNVPDILGTNELPVDRLAAKGYFEDLWPYIDADTELGGREGLVKPVFNALTNDEGKLWVVVSDFYVLTLMGPSRLVGDEPGWSFDDMYAALEQLPEGAEVLSYYYTRDEAMQSCCAMLMDDLVDWETGECSFDGPEFVNILNFVKMFPETIDYDSIDYSDYNQFDEYTRLLTGKQLLSEIYLSDFSWWREYDVLMGGGTFIGYPAGSGSGSAFGLSTGLVMSSTCKDKDGAWEFMRTFLTSDYQEENCWNFGTNKEYFDEQIANAMEPTYNVDENGEQVLATWNVWAGGEKVGEVNQNASQEDVDRVLALIEATDKAYGYDDTLYDIISEQCGAFFAGDKTAEETAKLVQSRMTLYVNEQR